MKKIVLYIIATILYTSIQGQTFNKNVFSGSWINAGIVDFYESTAEHNCDSVFFENFVPLYLSFENDKQLKITFRIEQTIFTYQVNRLDSDSILIHRGENNYIIYFLNNLLCLVYNHHLVTFKKVSNDFSSDVYGEYIKGIIFSKHKSYTVSFYNGSKRLTNSIISDTTFKQKIRELFRCDGVDFIQLGFTSYKNNCLPELALYYDRGINSNGPQLFGIFMNKDDVMFINSKGDSVLILKAN